MTTGYKGIIQEGSDHRWLSKLYIQTRISRVAGVEGKVLSRRAER